MPGGLVDDVAAPVEVEAADSQWFGLRVAAIPDAYLADRVASAWLRATWRPPMSSSISATRAPQF
jgi:hypothetical protein